MRLIRLSSVVDFGGWRSAARALAAEGIAPEAVEWRIGGSPSLLAEAPRAHPESTAELIVPRAFIEVAKNAALHSDAQRFALLYRLLWRLRLEPRLMCVAGDADVVRARRMADAVARDIHKTHAYVRFREVASDSGPVFVAWFEPTHHTLEASAAFFMRRFANARWSILTPRVSAHWDGAALRFGCGARPAQAPQGDALEDLWRTYYTSIFNPARLKTRSMQSHMPRKYWRNLPEARVISALVAHAPHATAAMIANAPTTPRLRAPTRTVATVPLRTISTESSPAHHAPDATPAAAFTALRTQAQDCAACALHTHATQCVFGEGPADAPVMFVGEQPGDHEDLAGRPFVGPAGQVFDRALSEAGFARSQVYVTNAVKHFKFEPRGKRRLHKTPAQREIEACRPWLEQEIMLLRPRLIVALGATAAHAILGQPTPVQQRRGRLMSVSDQTQVLVTVHPAYLLRVPEHDKAPEYGRFVEDLKQAQSFVAPHADEVHARLASTQVRSTAAPELGDQTRPL